MQAKRLAITTLLMLALVRASAQGEQWWSYLARYDDLPGSIRVNLGLRKVAPMPDYPYLVITGTTYSSTQRRGLPDASDVGRLNALQEQVVGAIEKQTTCVYAGTFTSNFEQLHYVYVKSTAGVAPALAKLYAERCAGCKTYTNLKQDPSWSAYSGFLFPNEATRSHYGLRVE